jgi:hypothetical protein
VGTRYGMHVPSGAALTDRRQGTRQGRSQATQEGPSRQHPVCRATATSVRWPGVLTCRGITKPAIRRLARRGGVKRISGLIYEETRGVLKILCVAFIFPARPSPLYRPTRRSILAIPSPNQPDHTLTPASRTSSETRSPTPSTPSERPSPRSTSSTRSSDRAEPSTVSVPKRCALSVATPRPALGRKSHLRCGVELLDLWSDTPPSIISALRFSLFLFRHVLPLAGVSEMYPA